MTIEAIEELIADYGTPAYVFDLDALSNRISMIHDTLQKSNIDLCYAMKANPFLVGTMESMVERFEVCSPGEFRICEREQLPMERLVISGVNKERADILRIVSQYQGRGIFTVESLRQLELLEECARETGKKLKILVRISSGNQFGVDFQQVKAIFSDMGHDPMLELLGIQYYSGTQKTMRKIKKELQKLDGWIQELTSLGVSVQELEYGPGFCVPYFQSEPEEQLQELLLEFIEHVSKMEFQGHVTLEMGRFLTADCGSFFTSIVDKKEIAGQIYGIVDGGIHHMNYYGQVMAMKQPFIQHIARNGQTGQRKEEWTICGSLCTSADVIVKQLPLIDAQEGDVLVFQRTGAYSVMEGISLFLSRDLPRVFFWSKNQGLKQVRKLQTTDLFNSRM